MYHTINHKLLLAYGYFKLILLLHSSDLVNYKPTVPIHAKCVANSKMKVLAKILQVPRRSFGTISNYDPNSPALLPDFIPGRTRYESVNYGISNY